jgi:L-fuconate dehydratase
MRSPRITSVRTRDARFPLRPGEGSDSVHSDPVYSYAVTELHTDSQHVGIGLAFTLGVGNDLVCRAIDVLAEAVDGREIEQLMGEYGVVSRRIADHPQMRWLGPHKGVVHLALASITNACFDLWAKTRGVPLWRLLVDLETDAVLATLDLSYLEDALDADTARALLEDGRRDSAARVERVGEGYPGYDTSIGWFDFTDEDVSRRTAESVGQGFTAVKLKVGSADGDRDIRRAEMVREIIGPEALFMLDVNQQWTLPQALDMCERLAGVSPYWVEEPTHPDDVAAHRTLAEAIAPICVAAGEHVPHRILFKNFLAAGGMQVCQVDCTRVAGVSEFIVVSLLARKFGVPVFPHVGDMGQIHQHLVLYNHIALGHERLFLEYIPHLREHFTHPAEVRDGRYATPTEPGSSSDLIATE